MTADAVDAEDDSSISQDAGLALNPGQRPVLVVDREVISRSWGKRLEHAVARPRQGEGDLKLGEMTRPGCVPFCRRGHAS
jgi:hypothetical protein